MLFLGLLSISTYGQEWEKYEDSDMLAEDSISVFYRYVESEGREFLEFRGELHARASISTLLAVIRDASNMHNWVYNLSAASSRVISDTERYTHMLHEPIFILKKRDSYIRSVLRQDPKTLQVVIDGESLPNDIPKLDGYVRVEKSRSKWELTPTAVGRTKVAFQGFADPGGWIGSSLLSPLAKGEIWKIPYYTLKGLNAQSKKDNYAKVRYPFIQEKQTP